MAAGDPLVQVADVEARTGRSYSGADLDRIGALISDASGLVFTLLGSDDPWPDGVPPGVVAIVCQMIQRGFENPRALSGETLGDYTWNGGASGGVYWTAWERRMLRRAYGQLSVGTVQLVGDMPISNRLPVFNLYRVLEDEICE